MGFKTGERVEFLDDGLVVRCLDLGSKSGCLGCCFLSYVCQVVLAVSRARAREGKKDAGHTVGSFLGRRELCRHARSRS